MFGSGRRTALEITRNELESGELFLHQSKNRALENFTHLPFCDEEVSSLFDQFSSAVSFFDFILANPSVLNGPWASTPPSRHFARDYIYRNGQGPFTPDNELIRMEESAIEEEVDVGSSSSNQNSASTPDVSAGAEKNKGSGRKGSGGQKKVGIADGTDSGGAGAQHSSGGLLDGGSSRSASTGKGKGNKIGGAAGENPHQTRAKDVQGSKAKVPIISKSK